MPFEAFGKLPFGKTFIYRDELWVKCPQVSIESKTINAFEPAVDKPALPSDAVATCLVDEAALVQTDTGVSPAQEQRYTNLFAELEYQRRRGA